MSPADLAKLAEISARPLLKGSHKSLSEGMCVMEAAAYVAGESWTDAPECACPVIASFMRSWNDGLPSDEDRDRLLRPFILDLVGSKSTPEVEERRSYLALDWLVRVYTPKWLDLRPELAAHAQALRDLEEIADIAGGAAAGVKTRAAGAAAWDAAWVAAGAAAWVAAGAAAGAAAGDAARAAAGDAAGAAAGDAARAAAGDAARAAAGDALKPTTEWLQASAVDLVRRMLEVTP